MRTPVYQQKILELFDQHHLLGISDLEKLVPKADYSTLFRNVKALVLSGDLKKITVDKNKVLYERAGHHHDHLICDGCGTVEAIHVPRPIGTNFIINEVVAHGACTDCTSKTI